MTDRPNPATVRVKVLKTVEGREVPGEERDVPTDAVREDSRLSVHWANYSDAATVLPLRLVLYEQHLHIPGGDDRAAGDVQSGGLHLRAAGVPRPRQDLPAFARHEDRAVVQGRRRSPWPKS
jgi:hypothetical protein